VQLPNNAFCNVVRHVIDWILRTTNITFSFRGTRTKIHSLTQLGAVYLLHRRNFGYDPYLLREPITHICDLGGNAGLFTVWINNFTFRSNSLSGLVVEANPSLLRTIKKNFVLNGIRQVRIEHGMVGDTSRVLYVSSSDQMSAVRPMPWMKVEYTKIIEVQPVLVSELWDQSPSKGKPCDLLKIDIEGSELEFLLKEADWIKNRVRRILVEWHSPRTTRDVLLKLLVDYGFVVHKVVGSQECACGVIYAHNAQRYIG
jgi:FkbM family methyltransferase